MGKSTGNGGWGGGGGGGKESAADEGLTRKESFKAPVAKPGEGERLPSNAGIEKVQHQGKSFEIG
ncbi:MAG: hypothetical protein HQM00_02275 [Magnetococcales bacterium]|nr:hypothetical protein [Magnetococcales bacterium]